MSTDLYQVLLLMWTQARDKRDKLQILFPNISPIKSRWTLRMLKAPEESRKGKNKLNSKSYLKYSSKD